MAKRNLSDSETEERNSGSSSDSGDSPVEMEPQSTGKITEYEKQRMKRIQENKARMEAMGLHNMATSLMGFSQKPQKKGKDKKGKKKVVDEDEDYEPAQSEDLSSASGEEDEQNDVDYDVSKSQLKKVQPFYFFCWLTKSDKVICYCIGQILAFLGKIVNFCERYKFSGAKAQYGARNLLCSIFYFAFTSLCYFVCIDCIL